MRHLLLIAVLTGVPASAQTLGPTVSGDARMGLVWQSGPDWTGQHESGLRMTSRARLKFQFTGETDSGVRYGVELRLNEAADGTPLLRPRRPQPEGPRVNVAQ